MLLGLLLATAHFTYHTVLGTHGLLVKGRLIERLDTIEREIATLEAVRRSLRRDIAALSQDPPDPDLIEEAARATLGFVAPGDLVVVRDRR